LPTKENKIPFPFTFAANLPTKENKTLFSISVCSKQMEICRFRFHLQQTKGSCCFPSVVFPFAEFQKHGDMETRKHGDRDMKWGNMEKWRHGDMAWRHGVETWTLRHGKEKWTWSHRISNGKRKPKLFSVIRLPFAHHAHGNFSFVHLLIKKTNGSCPFVNRLNGLNGLNGLN
jgi:hypothetical protein